MTRSLLSTTVPSSLLIGAALLLLAGCGPERATQAPPAGEPEAPESAGVTFVDRAPEMGIDLVTYCGNEVKNYIVEEFGSGAAVEDYDGDGDSDIYIATSQTIDAWRSQSGLIANALYRNNGDGTFTEVGEQAGVALRAWSLGAYFVDVDNDADMDLFVTTWGPNHLYRNNGDGTFTDISERAGLSESSFSASAGFGDLDGDGDLDLYVANYCRFDLENPPFGGARVIWKGIEVLAGPQGLPGEGDRLYRNDGDGRFTDVTEEAGVGGSTEPLYGLGVVMADLDDDGDLEIYVANDSVANYLWRNDGQMRFSEIGAVSGVAMNEDAREQAGMGTDAADYDGDGLIDLWVTNFSHDFNCLYRNRGGLVFTDATFEARFKDSFTKLVWGTKLFDFDHDGWLDIFVANGHVYPEVDDHPHLNTSFKQANALYRNRGDGTFANVTESAGPGLQILESSRGASFSDLDRDGDLDIVVVNVEARPTVLINETENLGAWLSVRLVGVRSSRDPIGARLELEVGGRRLVRLVNPFGSFVSQSGYPVHFGLGDATRAERLTIHWTSGEVEELTDLPARTFLTVTEGQGITGRTTPATAP